MSLNVEGFNLGTPIAVATLETDHQVIAFYRSNAPFEDRAYATIDWQPSSKSATGGHYDLTLKGATESLYKRAPKYI